MNCSEVCGPCGMRASVSAVGLAAILVAAARYTSAMPFPGWIALLPVLGAALLIWAGIGAPQVVTRRRDPITLIGDRSYSIYLLHWPAIIVAPYVLGHELGAAEKIMLLALVLVLAALSTDWVEDPVRRSAWLIARSWRTFVAMALAMALVIGAAVGAQYAIAQNRPAPEVVLGPGTCIAYDALVNPSCKKPFSPDEVDTGFAVTDESMACPWGTADAAFKICEFGAVEDYTHTLAYVGDSHASALLPGVIDSLPAGWRLLAYVTGGCASISREAYGAPGLHSVQKREQCKARTNTFLDLIEADSSVDAVMFTNYTRVYAAPPADGLKSLTAELIDATWRDLEDLGKSVIAVQDAPFLDVGSIPQCIDAAGDTYDPCTAPRSDAVLENDPMKAAVDLNDARTWIDISGSVCDDTTCHAVIGKTAAYFDADHISMRYSKSLPQFLRPLIGAALERVETAEAAAAR